MCLHLRILLRYQPVDAAVVTLVDRLVEMGQPLAHQLQLNPITIQWDTSVSLVDLVIC